MSLDFSARPLPTCFGDCFLLWSKSLIGYDPRAVVSEICLAFLGFGHGAVKTERPSTHDWWSNVIVRERIVNDCAVPLHFECARRSKVGSQVTARGQNDHQQGDEHCFSISSTIKKSKIHFRPFCNHPALCHAGVKQQSCNPVIAGKSSIGAGTLAGIAACQQWQ